MNILVIRACGVGDFVLNLPALQALQECHPEAGFTLVGYPERLSIAREFINVEAMHSLEVEPWNRLFHEVVTGLPFDRVIVWMKDPTVAENLRLSGLPNVSWLPPFSESDHAARHLLKTLGLPEPELPDRWRPESNRILLHPGSGSPRKCWPYFRELAGRLKNVAFLIGPAEANFDTGIYPRFEHQPLVEVAALLSRAGGFVGNDSGITHLAAYLGCPTLALFGPTDPEIWGPIGRRVQILRKTPLDCLTPAEVVSAGSVLRIF